MKLKHLELTSFRIFEQATFDFQPGMNLIVGINGTGKSSVLDALRMLLARALPNFTASEKPFPASFSADDFTVGRYGLTGELHFTNGSFYSVRVTQDYASRAVPQLPPSIETEGEWHGPTAQEMQSAPEPPIAVYFSPYRSRELGVRKFVEWVSVQNPRVKLDDNHVVLPGLERVHSAITRFLDDYTHIAAAFGKETIELLDKDKKRLDIKQLSDGERGLLALVLDLARRLSQANLKLDDPLRDGEGIVLIDELDLHLHPSWQRTVVENLTKTFPNCQFIATTHSPQIIGEVPPDNIILLERGKPPYRPDQALGMDSNWILRHLMGASERDSEIERELSRIAGSIEDEQYDKATAAIETLRSTLGEFPELVRLQTRIDRIRLLGE
jgi:ABC-type multidrug transport system ATPase subunit